MRVIDLCCGAGGWSEGLRQAGLTPVLGVDSWNIAIQSYHDNFPEAKKFIKKVQHLTAEDLPDAEVIVGSPPCQKASIANIGYKGEIDYDPLYHILNLIERKKPRYWVLENVPPYWRKMPEELKERIPAVKAVTANEHGLNHKRVRMFFGRFPEPKEGTKATILFRTPVATEYACHQCKGSWSTLQQFWEYLKERGLKVTQERMLWAMGFPPGYRLAGSRIDKIKQAGNAVCPPVARAFGLAIMRQEKEEQQWTKNKK